MLKSDYLGMRLATIIVLALAFGTLLGRNRTGARIPGASLLFPQPQRTTWQPNGSRSLQQYSCRLMYVHSITTRAWRGPIEERAGLIHSGPTVFL